MYSTITQGRVEVSYFDTRMKREGPPRLRTVVVLQQLSNVRSSWVTFMRHVATGSTLPPFDVGWIIDTHMLSRCEYSLRSFDRTAKLSSAGYSTSDLSSVGAGG